MTNQLLTAAILGCIYGIMVLGVYISFRILKIPDLTVDGTIILGMSTGAVCVRAGHPILALFAGLLAGMLAGLVTALLQTKLKITPILAGILTMTGLYSVCLQLQGTSPNVSLLGTNTIFSMFIERMPGLDKNTARLLLTILIAAVLLAVVIWFFKTRLGLYIRATGDNEEMIQATSISENMMKTIALMMANGLVGVAGVVYGQYMGYADVTAGSGTVVSGFASVIIGEAVIFFVIAIIGNFAPRIKNLKSSLTVGFIAAILGSVAYRIIVALAINANILPSHFLKFVTMLIIILALAVGPVKNLLLVHSNKVKRTRSNSSRR